jgi:hypothetical protein
MTKNDNLIQLLEPIDLPITDDQLGISKPKKPLYGIVFLEANRFSDNYLMLVEAMERDRGLDFYSPMLMNLAFSNELFLKCLILIENSDVYNYSDLLKKNIIIKGHRLSALFSKIKIDSKTQILKEFSQKSELPEIDEETFIKILKNQNCDNSFAEWRYIFETEKNKTINFQILEHLNEILKRFNSKRIQKMDAENYTCKYHV